MSWKLKKIEIFCYLCSYFCSFHCKIFTPASVCWHSWPCAGCSPAVSLGQRRHGILLSLWSNMKSLWRRICARMWWMTTHCKVTEIFAAWLSTILIVTLMRVLFPQCCSLSSPLRNAAAELPSWVEAIEATRPQAPATWLTLVLSWGQANN